MLDFTVKRDFTKLLLPLKKSYTKSSHCFLVFCRYWLHDVSGVFCLLLVLYHGTSVGACVPGQLIPGSVTMGTVWAVLEH